MTRSTGNAILSKTDKYCCKPRDSNYTQICNVHHTNNICNLKHLRKYLIDLNKCIVLCTEARLNFWKQRLHFYDREFADTNDWHPLTQIPFSQPLCTLELNSPRILFKDSKRKQCPLSILSIHVLIEPFLLLLSTSIRFLGILMGFHGLWISYSKWCQENSCYENNFLKTKQKNKPKI